MEIVHLPTPTGPRRYLLFAPPEAVGAPLLLLLHGTGGTAEWAVDETQWHAMALRERFVLAVPEAIPPDATRPPKFLTNPQRWNDGSTRPGDLLHSSADDVGFLSAAIDDALARTGADPRRVSVTGFSNGAGMAFRLAAERSEKLAAVAPVAGYCWIPYPRPLRPVPTLYVIGTDDPLVPPAGGPVRLPWGGRRVVRPPVSETLARWAAANRCDPIPRPISDGDGVREDVYAPYPDGAEVRAFTIAGLGHHWPGGKGQLAERFGGKPSSRVDGNALVWNFLRRWSRENSRLAR